MVSDIVETGSALERKHIIGAQEGEHKPAAVVIIWVRV